MLLPEHLQAEHRTKGCAFAYMTVLHEFVTKKKNPPSFAYFSYNNHCFPDALYKNTNTTGEFWKIKDDQLFISVLTWMCIEISQTGSCLVCFKFFSFFWSKKRGGVAVNLKKKCLAHYMASPWLWRLHTSSPHASKFSQCPVTEAVTGMVCHFKGAGPFGLGTSLFSDFTFMSIRLTCWWLDTH